MLWAAYPEFMSTDGRAVVPTVSGADVVEQVLARVREHGGRATTARRLLLAVLVAGPAHQRAEELAAAVQARAPDVNLSTLYRHLDEFERLGVVDRTRGSHGPATYHLALAAHGHLVCEVCGSVTEVPGEVFGGLAAAAREGYGFAVSPRHYAVSGRCAGCQP